MSQAAVSSNNAGKKICFNKDQGKGNYVTKEKDFFFF